MTNCVDFNLHNLFSIRLEDPSPKAVRAVQNQVGLQPSVIDSDPDLTVRYVERLKSPMHHIVMGSTGFIDDEFHLVTGQGRQSHRVQFPFDCLGQRCTITCETGTTEIPLLNLIINMRMLSKGMMPIHASAFVFNDTGVVVNGWPHGGKTSTLFSFLAHGAKFVSDDWLFVGANGAVYGLMQPIKLSDWQLDQLPDFQSKVNVKKQWAIQGFRWLDSVERFVPEKTRSTVAAAKVFHRGVQFLNKSQRHVTLSPEKLFGTGFNLPTGRLDVMFLTLSHESSDITVTPIPAEEAMERLLSALHYEWSKWEEYYIQYLYAFPQRRNFRMDVARDKQRNLLRNILSGKQTFLVNHPHPVKLDELYSAVNTVLDQIKETKQVNDPVAVAQ